MVDYGNQGSGASVLENPILRQAVPKTVIEACPPFASSRDVVRLWCERSRGPFLGARTGILGTDCPGSVFQVQTGELKKEEFNDTLSLEEARIHADRLLEVIYIHRWWGT
jgi:hypothetical protein